VKFPLGTTVAVIDAQAIALASIIAPITGCVLIRQRIIYKAAQFPRGVAGTGSSIYNAGVFIWTDEGEENNNIFTVPGILEEVILSTGSGAEVLIDTSNADVIAVIDAYTSSGMVNIFGEACDVLKAAYRQSRA
jgi:hypothetical protein